MKLIVGLGNPGKKYSNTWHNIGFLVLDELAKTIKTKFKDEKKFSASLALGNIADEKIILAKPMTFMNNSGEAVSKLLKFYKIDGSDLIVIHDDVDINFGKLRIAKNSSAGGHNGIKSIININETQDFTRVKVGVKTEKLGVVDTADYVLERINKKLSKEVKNILETTTNATICIIEKSLQEAMNLYN